MGRMEDLLPLLPNIGRVPLVEPTSLVHLSWLYRVLRGLYSSEELLGPYGAGNGG